MKEIWKDIRGYEGLYKVSSIGNVKGLKRNKNIYGKVQKDGYRQVILSKNNTRKYCFVHRLVANEFLKNPLNKNQINHKNGIKTDNRVENLEWCSCSENMKHAYKNGLEKPLIGKNNPRAKKIIQYDLNNNIIAVYDGIKDAGRQLGLCAGHISKCCKNKTKTSGGFVWRYAND